MTYLKHRPLDPYLDRFGSFVRRQISRLAAKSPSAKPRATRDQIKALKAKYAKGKAA